MKDFNIFFRKKIAQNFFFFHLLKNSFASSISESPKTSKFFSYFSQMYQNKTNIFLQNANKSLLLFDK